MAVKAGKTEEANPAGTMREAPDVPQVDRAALRSNYRFPSVPAGIVAEVTGALRVVRGRNDRARIGRRAAPPEEGRARRTLRPRRGGEGDRREGRGRGTRFRLAQTAHQERRWEQVPTCEWADVPFDALSHD